MAKLVDFGRWNNDEIMSKWHWPLFTPYEMRQRENGIVIIQPEFMDLLQDLRNTFGHPMPVSSYYRSPEYNASISRSGLDGPHTTGRAIDIKVSGYNVALLTSAAVALGFTGFGWQQKGGGRFLHLDTLEPRSWSY